MASSSEPWGARSWWKVVGGVAVASSAITTLSILSIQRLHRKQKRLELEEDIRKATKGHNPSGKGSNTADEQVKEKNEGKSNKQEPSIGDSAVPKYLAALSASQDGVPTPRSSSPRPAIPSTMANFQHLTRQSSLQLRPSLSSTSSTRNIPISTPNYDDALIREQLSRNYSFLGDEAMSKLRESFVIVVGAGGVGSWCALMLLRSGVGKLRLIDFDQVSLSSLNRHACANLADVGRPKVVVCKEHFAQIAPWADVEAQVEIFRGDDAPRLLGPFKDESSSHDSSTPPTYVVDAIDNLDTKVDLLAYCYKHKIKCFSSMGAGAKADPGQIQIADLNMTAEDPLARRVRRSLRAKYVWSGGAMLTKQEMQRLRKKEKKVSNGTKGGKETQDRPALDKQDSQVKKETDRQATLEKLESRANSFAGKKLEASGRGAEVNSRQSLTLPETSAMPGKGAEGVGYSRYSSSRRTSSASSRGSAQFFSPQSTPNEDVSSPLDTEEFQNGIKDTFRLPDAVQVDQASKEEETDTVPKRPSLSTLISSGQESSSSEAGPSRRTSSLKELVAEDVRSSQSGKLARRTPSGVAPSMEDLEEEAINNDEEHEEEPFKIMCVYSNEKSDTRLLPLDEEEFQKGKVDELAALEDFRVRILPVLGPLPAMFGLAAATYIICDIGGKQLETIPWKNRRKTYERLWAELEALERRYPVPGSGHDSSDVALGPRRIPWSVEDVGYVFEEVYRGRSVVPPYETLVSGKMLRWDSTLPLSYSNVAVFSRSQGSKHEQEVLKNGKSPVGVWGDEAYRMFKRRMAEERRMNVLR